MAERRIHCVVHGLVQGVNFRAATRREAERLGVRGWVRNLEDETVELVAEGEEAALFDLLGWLRRGPRLARVERIDEAWEAPDGGFAGFAVRF
jgi:acylphosphatase